MKKLKQALPSILLLVTAIVSLAALMRQGDVERIPYDVHEVPLEAEADDSSDIEDDEIDWTSLPDSVVAWARVPGTTVDYPVMQGSADDPNFYLRHNMHGVWSSWGTPYIDPGCSDGMESPLVIVYGHHMSDGTMFAPLAQYSSRSFAEEHRAIYVFTREKTYVLQVFAADVVNASAEGKRTAFEDAEDLQDYIVEKLDGCAVVLERLENLQQAWAFVTCSYQTSNSRIVVYAKEVES